MELIITEKKASICLNMIVKNESHIIKNTLEKLCNKIQFDYWVICDTGSTDNTPQIILDFFKNKQINGELYIDEWVNFAHNRTLALERAFKKTQLLLVFDADDELVGNICIPENVLFDEYHLKFGSANGVSYTRVLLINNYKRFEYQSVIHEFINCKEPNSTSTVIDGDYYVVSGRTGSRSMDPNKYLKDAIILEKAYEEALKNNDQLFHRYAYYCGNSYKDCGRCEDAIKWYKKTLEHKNQWAQEKYTACLYIYDCFTVLKKPDAGFFYLVKSFSYDLERVECLYPLLVHYCCEDMNRIAYNYYLNIKDFFENKYLETNMSNKLFISQDKYNFFVPYYMVLIADKVKDFNCVIRMYEIVFIKKQKMFEEWYVRNFLYNLQFFFQHVPNHNTHFIPLANEYIIFLFDNGVNIASFDFLKLDIYSNAGINLDNIFIKKLTNKINKFSEVDCRNSKNILFYTGFSNIDWNHSYMISNALGGSEKAVVYLSKCFPKDYTIYISGHVTNEVFDNIQYIHLDQLTNLINEIPFHTVIVSRYIAFYEMFKECSFSQSFIWAHDVLLLPYGCNLNANQILEKWNNYIDGIICLTDWHRNLFKDKYPEIKDKIHIINNGLDINSFNRNSNCYNIKIKNKFMYSSRPERGLNVLLELWPTIIKALPDATLVVSTYGNFPSTTEDCKLKVIIDRYSSIQYLGNLNTKQLYDEMNSAEYWLYPTSWPETSCITALEMLMSEVICLYYPVAGLINTVESYGIKVQSGNELETILKLNEEQKNNLRKNGRKFAESCSWENRSHLWTNLLFKNNNNLTLLNTKLTNKKFIFLHNYIEQTIYDYSLGLKEFYDIDKSNDFNFIINSKPNEIFFITSIDKYYYELFKKLLPNCKISLLNLDPLNLEIWIKNIKNTYLTYKPALYDYSLSNIKIIMDNNFVDKDDSVIFLPYIHTEKESTFLKNLYNTTNKSYDFGILTGCGAANNIITELGHKRRKVVTHLLSLGFTVNIIHAWKEERDMELAKCNYILNIHGQLTVNNFWVYSGIFEHLRCDRLLNAGFKILSEESYELDTNFINKYKENLKLIPMIDFFKLETYLELSLRPNIVNIKRNNYCFIHSCTLPNVGTSRLDYLIQRIEDSKSILILDQIFIINIGIPIENKYGEKFNITNYSADCHLYEAPTLNKIIDFSIVNPHCNILYLHTKGIRYNENDEKENNWIDLMLYGLLYNHNKCIEKLNESYDVVGCNYIYNLDKNINPHFSGNFWWANTDYLKYLDKLNEDLKDRNSGEFLLFKNSPIFYIMYNSNIDHYQNTYPKSIYQNQPIKDQLGTFDFGFIILRNVTSIESNKYWIECYSSIRQFYPENQIIIIDVNAENNLVTNKELTNTMIFKSNYIGNNVLMAFLFYIEINPFEHAVIMNDKMFFNSHVEFYKENKFLWQFEHDWDNTNLELELISKLDNHDTLLKVYMDKQLWKGCFESACFISYELLQEIHKKYNLLNLTKFITNSETYSCFERIIGLLITVETNSINKVNMSLCGDIHWTANFSLNFETYIQKKRDLIFRPTPITKVFH